MGDPHVGKTALQMRYMGMGFRQQYIPTLGANFSVKDMEVNGIPVRLSIVDLSGQKNFHSLREQYFKGVSAVLLVFDVTRPYAADKQTLPWIRELLDFTNHKGVPLAILGNKIDLEHIRQIEPYAGINVATEVHEEITKPTQYFETSAKNGTEIDAAFEWIISALLKDELGTTKSI